MHRTTDPEHRDSTKAEATRGVILGHAMELFAHYGFWKTNIGDIAEACGMSPGNLYRYYRNKQAIGLAAVERYFASAEVALAAVEARDTQDAETRIRAWIETGVQHLVDELECTPKIVELAEFLCADDEGIAILRRHIDWKRTHLAAEIARGIRAGTLEPCDPEARAATILNALKAFWMPMTLAQWRDPETVMPELRQILDLMFSGLRSY